MEEILKITKRKFIELVVVAVLCISAFTVAWYFQVTRINSIDILQGPDEKEIHFVVETYDDEKLKNFITFVVEKHESSAKTLKSMINSVFEVLYWVLFLFSIYIIDFAYTVFKIKKSINEKTH